LAPRAVFPGWLTQAMVSTTAVLDARGVRRRGQLYVALAALAWSTAGVLQRELTVSTATQVAGRAFVATLALFGFVWLQERGNVLRRFRGVGRAELLVAVCTAIASGTFIVALNHTTVANVLFMQALAPIAAALIAWVALRESVSRRTGVAMVIALAGVGIMVGGPGGAKGLGLVLSVVMTLAFALAVVVTRHRRDISMAPAICLSQLIVVAVVAPFAEPGTINGHDLLFIVLLGVGQMGLGLAFLTMGARLISAAEVALITLLEVVVGPAWVWLVDGEQPSTTTLVGGAVVVAAVALQAGGEPHEAPAADESRPAAAHP
jgi:drug/metabolite transporter (DMT)-like permease